jgi:phosphoribosyl-ATP pyrophosphohydrolase
MSKAAAKPPEFSLEALAARVAVRARSGDPNSYTASLVAKGVAECAKKLGEEAVEAAIAAVAGDRDQLRWEAADVLFHLLVLLHAAGVGLDEVTGELGRRTAKGGFAEKASRQESR